MRQPSAVDLTKKKRKPPVQKDHLSIIKPLRPLNEAQRQFIFAYKSGLNVIGYGSAGTGKTYLACNLALEELLSGAVEKIVIVRSAVQVRDQGFLPGSLAEKMDPFTAPYRDIFNELCGNGTAWDILTKKYMVEFVSTSFIRGVTLKNCVVIFDEYQSSSFHELDTVATRAGDNCRMVFVGDMTQNDLIKNRHDCSGYSEFMRIVKVLPDFYDLIQFTPDDIVRSGLVKAYIKAKEALGI